MKTKVIVKDNPFIVSGLIGYIDGYVLRSDSAVCAIVITDTQLHVIETKYLIPINQKTSQSQ